ncbi:hypothetical protein ACFQ58_04615 [Agromyces sp. NPDC056523]|uniref:hypothetical protein n=1 Tax=Agromyces sp. NPDC056523 TaxID=3345850 RepID=UPI00366ED679
MPRTPRRLAALLLAGVTLTSLAACATAEPEPTSPPPVESATDEPIFASDEEALAAAVAAYQSYTKVNTQLSADPNIDVGRLREVATESHAAETIESLGSLRESGVRTTGEVTLRGFRLAEVTDDGTTVGIRMYACNELSQYRLIDAAGKDITPIDRADAVTFLVSLEGNTSELLVSATEPWSGSSVC